MVEITINGEKRKIDVRQPSEGDRFEWLEIAMKTEEDRSAKVTLDYLKYERDLLCRLTGLNEEDFKKISVLEGDQIRAEVIPKMTLWREKVLKEAESDMQDFSTGSEPPPTSSTNTQTPESISSKPDTETKESPEKSEK